MSKFVPSDSELKSVPLYYNTFYVGIPKEGIETPQVIQDNITLAEENHQEIITWGIFLNAYLGRGIQAYLRKPNGKISYPPRFLQGAFLMFLNKNEMNAISSYDRKEKTIVGILDQKTESFHLFEIPLPNENDIPILEFQGAEFSDTYRIEEDDAELLRSSDIDFLKSRLAYKDSDYKKALFYLDKVLERNPNYSRAYSARGVNYYTYQNMIYALANYFDGLEVNPNNWRSLYNIGIIMSEVGLFDLAQKYYEACLVINPKCTDAQFNLDLIIVKQSSQVQLDSDVIDRELNETKSKFSLEEAMARFEKLSDAMARSKTPLKELQSLTLAEAAKLGIDVGPTLVISNQKINNRGKQK
jgi:tetratricopeptide (TPR) repeat protein